MKEDITWSMLAKKAIEELLTIYQKHASDDPAEDFMADFAKDVLKNYSPIEEQPGEYWKQLAEAAEKVIQCLPDRPENLYELGFKQAMNNWQKLKNANQ